MKYFLIKFDKDWADEFDVYGFRMIKSNSIEEVIENYEYSVVGKPFMFGTNQGWEEDEIEISDFEFTEISEAEYDVIKKLFGTSFGVIP